MIPAVAYHGRSNFNRELGDWRLVQRQPWFLRSSLH